MRAFSKWKILKWEILMEKAATFREQGQYKKAVKVAKKALKVAEKTFRPEPVALDGLAVLYAAQGRYVKAEALFKRALAIWEKALGKDHPDVATVLENMAELYEEVGKEDEAKRLAERAKGIRSGNQ